MKQLHSQDEFIGYSGYTVVVYQSSPSNFVRNHKENYVVAWELITSATLFAVHHVPGKESINVKFAHCH